MEKLRIDVRTRAVIFNNVNEILVQHDLTSKPDFYRLPGGGVLFREKLEDCLIREVKEETGLDVKVDRLLWVRDYLNGYPNHSIEVFFLATMSSGEFKLKHTSESIEFRFVTIEELKQTIFYPKTFIPKLERLRNNRTWFERNPYVRSAN